MLVCRLTILYSVETQSGKLKGFQIILSDIKEWEKERGRLIENGDYYNQHDTSSMDDNIRDLPIGSLLRHR